MNRSILRAVLRPILLAVQAAAQPAPPVPPLPATIVNGPVSGPAGITVQVVDAVAGKPVEGANFRWVQSTPKSEAGAFLLGRGTHWFEVSAPEHIGRRDSISVTTKHPAGVLRVPLLPKLVFLSGRFTPALGCTVDVPAPLALAPLFPASAVIDVTGNLLIAVLDKGAVVPLTAHVLGSTVTVPVPTDARASFKVHSHAAIPVVEFTHAFELEDRERAAVEFTQRRLRARAHFGNKAWKQAVDAGLQWLAAHQDPDGRWDADGFMKQDVEGEPCGGAGEPYFDAGVTGLALMAFLGDGHSSSSGSYRATVRRGVDWLLRQRIEGDVIHATDTRSRAVAFIYQHCIATIALSEAYVAAGAVQEWQGPIQRAVSYTDAHRNPYGVWRYQRQSGDNDISATLWATLAVVMARDAGFAVDHKGLDFVAAYVDEMTDENGRTGYIEKGGLSARLSAAHADLFPADRVEAMTAAAVLMRHALGQDHKTSPVIAKQVQLVAKKPPVWKAGAHDFYYWSLGTQALWLAGGPAWDGWSKAVADAVLKHQREDGNARGSWDPIDAWGEEGGRVYATAILLLGLQSPWRLVSR